MVGSNLLGVSKSSLLCIEMMSSDEECSKNDTEAVRIATAVDSARINKIRANQPGFKPPKRPSATAITLTDREGTKKVELQLFTRAKGEPCRRTRVTWRSVVAHDSFRLWDDEEEKHNTHTRLPRLRMDDGKGRETTSMTRAMGDFIVYSQEPSMYLVDELKRLIAQRDVQLDPDELEPDWTPAGARERHISTLSKREQEVHRINDEVRCKMQFACRCSMQRRECYMIIALFSLLLFSILFRMPFS